MLKNQKIYLVVAKVLDNYKIRKIKENEIDELLVLCEKHALYESSPFSYKNKKENLKKYLFEKNTQINCLVVEYENKLIAYTTYIKQFSTWDASYYLYMDCLFIDEEYRSLGLGKILLSKIKNEAKRLECFEIQWQTPSSNIKAIKFYKKNNAIAKNKERFFLKT